MKDNYDEIERKMEISIKLFSDDLAAIRAGRANPALLDKVMVDYYGVPTPITQMATINVPEAHIITIAPWDAKSLSVIEKAIQKSDLNLNPQNDGRVIRLNFPPLTEERRKEIVKSIHKKTEEVKVAVRNQRRESLELYKAMKKKSEITEDDLKDAEKDLQELTDNKIKEIDKITQKKENEIMEV